MPPENIPDFLPVDRSRQRRVDAEANRPILPYATESCPRTRRDLLPPPFLNPNNAVTTDEGIKSSEIDGAGQNIDQRNEKSVADDDSLTRAPR